jgi:hypothetical protein
MENHAGFENHFKMVDSILNSTQSLIDLLKSKYELNEKLSSTVGEIFKFIAKILNILPDLLVTQGNIPNKKADLLRAFDRVVYSWDLYPQDAEEFIKSWDEFITLWKEFYQNMDNVNKSARTIFLSMN